MMDVAPASSLKLSCSKTKTWDHCRKQYQFNYILHLPKIERDFHTFGKCLHKALEDFHLAYIKGSFLPHNEEMKFAWQAAKSEYASKMSPDAIKEAKDILSQYLKHLTTKPKDYVYKVLSAEEPFKFALTDNIILNGFIDKIHLDEDGMTHISDYKSTKNKKYLKDDWFQLMTYAFVVMHNNPALDRVRMSYVLLRHDFEHITKEVSRDEVQAVKGQYEDFARDINQATDYPATTSQLCFWCDFLDACEEGKRAVGKVSKEPRHGQIDW